jgi:hypothetical protein
VLRALALWAGLFGVYAATLGTHAFGSSQYGGDEPHYLLAAHSLVHDGDLDLRNQYAARDYARFYPYALQPQGRPTRGRRHEPHPPGFPAFIAPAYALGGARAVELLLAGVAALAFVLAAALARRLVPEPWATAGPLVCALSPPALAYATAVSPELLAGALLAAAALLALAARERPRARTALAAAAPIAVLPWLDAAYLLPGAVVLVVLLRWLHVRGRRFAGLAAMELVIASAVACITVNGRLFGGLTADAAAGPGQGEGAGSLSGYLHRAYRLVALWIDRDYGLLRWAPFLALAFLAGWLLWRSRRDHLARALPAQREADVAAGLLVAVATAQVAVAAFLAPTMLGFWFPGRHLIAALPVAAALCAWGLRHAPRAGAALSALTLAASVWLYVAVRTGDTGWSAPTSSAPWGPLERLLPLYGTSSAWPAIATGIVAAGLALLMVREWRRRRARAELSGAPTPA